MACASTPLAAVVRSSSMDSSMESRPYTSSRIIFSSSTIKTLYIVSSHSCRFLGQYRPLLLLHAPQRHTGNEVLLEQRINKKDGDNRHENLRRRHGFL